MEKDYLHKSSMGVVVVLEHRFSITPDGKIWTSTTCAYSFWKRYLEVFDYVKVVARACPVSSVPTSWVRADGEGVSFVVVPHYIGAWQYFLKAKQVKQTVQSAFNINDAVILRVSSQLGTCLYPSLLKTRHPYAVEVVADPYDVFAPGSIKHPLRSFFRWMFTRRLRYHCINADAAAYVTQEALQKRYPCTNYSIGVSDVELPAHLLAATPRVNFKEKRPLTLITVGTQAQLYKAPDVLIKAFFTCVENGLDLRLVLVGDGQYRHLLEAQAKSLGLEKRVNFLGQLPAGDAVISQLDQADLFVLPSHQEGLPRAMVEAMARALPVIGSTVGGIPELLSEENMVPPGDVQALANKIHEVVTDPERMTQMSAKNLEKAKEYSNEVLQAKRLGFYRHVRKTTEAWLSQQNV